MRLKLSAVLVLVLLSFSVAAFATDWAPSVVDYQASANNVADQLWSVVTDILPSCALLFGALLGIWMIPKAIHRFVH